MASLKHSTQHTPPHHHRASIEMRTIDSDILELVKTDNVEKLAVFAGSTRLCAVGDGGATLLHTAVACQSLSVLRFLLDDGTIPVNTQDNSGDTALHVAVRSGSVEAVNMVLDRGADDTITNNCSDPPLHILLQREDCCELLTSFLKHPIDIHVTGAHGYTALHVLAALDKMEALTVLWPVICARDSLSELKIYVRDNSGKAPLHVAAHRGSPRVLDFLISKAIECGASPDSVLHLMDEGSRTLLHTAVEHGHKSVVDVLLKHGASPTSLRGHTLPPIHLACAQNKTDIAIDMVKVCGREVLHCRDSSGATPLHCCTKSVCDELFSFVAERCSDLDSQDDNGATPLHAAVLQGGAWRVEFLLSKGASPMILNKRGYNPFHLCLLHHREEVFQVLAKSEYASLLSVTPDAAGDFPIHLAVEYKSTHSVPTLLSLMDASE